MRFVKSKPLLANRQLHRLGGCFKRPWHVAVQAGVKANGNFARRGGSRCSGCNLRGAAITGYAAEEIVKRNSGISSADHKHGQTRRAYRRASVSAAHNIGLCIMFCVFSHFTEPDLQHFRQAGQA